MDDNNIIYEIQEYNEYTVEENSENISSISVETIHTDLGVIISFLSIFSVIVFSIIIYRFFKIFF